MKKRHKMKDGNYLLVVILACILSIAVFVGIGNVTYHTMGLAKFFYLKFGDSQLFKLRDIVVETKAYALSSGGTRLFTFWNIVLWLIIWISSSISIIYLIFNYLPDLVDMLIKKEKRNKYVDRLWLKQQIINGNIETKFIGETYNKFSNSYPVKQKFDEWNLWLNEQINNGNIIKIKSTDKSINDFSCTYSVNYRKLNEWGMANINEFKDLDFTKGLASWNQDTNIILLYI